MKRMKLINVAMVFICLLGLSACKDEPSVKQYRVQKAPGSPPPAQNPVSAPEGLPFSWTVPAGWKQGKPSAMRTASYEVPLDGETGDFSLVRLGGGAGGVMANLNRWRGQIGLGPVSAEEVSNFAHARSTVQGRPYLLVTLVNPDNPGSGISAAIFDLSDYVLFAKLTASQAGLEKAQPSFEAFCQSLTFTGG
ncbi:MAG: hypothetical protein F7B06_07750 [Opitutae bacterium]|nr:hypothetical protein [Opitutae bacterium]MBC9889730.1 hypothetical protein [Opitutae bacterium]